MRRGGRKMRVRMKLIGTFNRFARITSFHKYGDVRLISFTTHRGSIIKVKGFRILGSAVSLSSKGTPDDDGAQDTQDAQGG